MRTLRPNPGSLKERAVPSRYRTGEDWPGNHACAIPTANFIFKERILRVLQVGRQSNTVFLHFTCNLHPNLEGNNIVIWMRDFVNVQNDPSSAEQLFTSCRGWGHQPAAFIKIKPQPSPCQMEECLGDEIRIPRPRCFSLCGDPSPVTLLEVPACLICRGFPHTWV